MSSLSPDRRQAFLVFLTYLGFVVYGSLVPFEVRDMTLDEAMQSFSRISFLKLGIGSRADWVANIVLYVPLAFFGCVFAVGIRAMDPLRNLRTLGVLILCLAVAVAVEFTQTFFAPRTVSLNDLMAEAIGTGLGWLLFASGRWRLSEMWRAFRLGGRASLLAAITVYLLGYLGLSLFPFDFVVSAQELSDKLESGSHGWFWPDACASTLRCLAGLASDALVLMPAGLLLALAVPGISLRRLFLAGAMLGCLLEGLQLLLASGVAVGASVILRGAGFALGGLAGRFLLRSGPLPLAHLLRRALPLLVVPYLAGLTMMSGWYSESWTPGSEGLSRLGDIRFLPFYYHYYTTESQAMVSLLGQIALYSPVGVAVWAWRREGRRQPLSPAVAMAVAALLALIMEFGKLMLPGQHPDPTNLLIAALSAGLCCELAQWLERVLTSIGPRDLSDPLRRSPARRAITADGFVLPSRVARRKLAISDITATAPMAPPAETAWDSAGPGSAAPVPAGVSAASAGLLRELAPDRSVQTPSPAIHSTLPSEDRDEPAPLRESLPRSRRSRRKEGGPPRLASLLLALPPALAALPAALLGVIFYPAEQGWLALALLGYGALIWWHPVALFGVLPVALAILDFSPWTGRLPLDEFDLVVLVTLCIGIFKVCRNPLRPWPNRTLRIAVNLLWMSWAMAMARGLWPVLEGEASLAPSAHSPVAAWLAGKGLLWAMLLVTILRRWPRETTSSARQRLAEGVLAGLLGVVAAVVLERHVFVGLWDFGNVFRVTGTFFSMNTGGAYIEAFLAFAFPFLAARLLGSQVSWEWGLLLTLAVCATYAMLMTFSRGGYAGLVAGLLPLAVAAWARGAGAARRVALAGVAVAVLAVAIPVVTGGFARQRLDRSGADFAVRWSHWRNALSLLEPPWTEGLFGAGFGRYPFRYASGGGAATPPGSYSVQGKGDQAYLHLGGGDRVYLDQWVHPETGTPHRLSLRYRSAPGGALPAISLCEKALLYSFDCVAVPLKADPSNGANWTLASADFQSAGLGTGGGWPHRPVKLSLGNPQTGASQDLDDISLQDAGGRELLANGDFREGLRHWLFVSDQDLAWHIHQTEIEVLFAQGLPGLAALGMLLVGVGRILWPSVRRGDLEAAASAGALLAFLTVGLLGSTLDEARLSMLFYQGALASALLTALPEKEYRSGNIRG